MFYNMMELVAHTGEKLLLDKSGNEYHVCLMQGGKSAHSSFTHLEDALDLYRDILTIIARGEFDLEDRLEMFSCKTYHSNI